MQYTIQNYEQYQAKEIVPLYGSVGWTAYTPALLERAFARSLCTLVACVNGSPVGLIRAVGDGASILYVQDLLVRPDCQRQGIGTALLQALRERYPDIYQLVLLTDDTAKTAAFYRSLGLHPVEERGCRCFVNF